MKWNAKWIGVEDLDRKKNFYCYFRRKFKISKLPKKAEILCSADSQYILYINGQRLGRGPARFFPGRPAYDTYQDAQEYLLEGQNVISVLFHYIGENTFSNLKGKGGFFLQLDVGTRKNRKTILSTNKEWKVKPSSAWSPDAPRFSLQIGFTEIFDARKEPVGWQKLNFNDENWQSAYEIDFQDKHSTQTDSNLTKTNLSKEPKLEPSGIPLFREQYINAANVFDFGLTIPPSPPEDITDLAPWAEKEKRISDKIQIENITGALGKGGCSAIIPPSPDPQKCVYIAIDFGKEVE